MNPLFATYGDSKHNIPLAQAFESPPRAIEELRRRLLDTLVKDVAVVLHATTRLIVAYHGVHTQKAIVERKTYSSSTR